MNKRLLLICASAALAVSTSSFAASTRVVLVSNHYDDLQFHQAADVSPIASFLADLDRYAAVDVRPQPEHRDCERPCDVASRRSQDLARPAFHLRL